MPKLKTRYILYTLIILIFVATYLSSPQILDYIRLKTVVSAAGTCPYQIGLKNVSIGPCFTTGSPPLCEGHVLPYCYTLDVARCLNYAEVLGTPAGGMGANALFLNLAIAKAGLTPGADLIACGQGPTLMDAGVAASYGGCFGCGVAQNNIIKAVNWIDKYLVAGFLKN